MRYCSEGGGVARRYCPSLCCVAQRVMEDVSTSRVRFLLRITSLDTVPLASCFHETWRRHGSGDGQHRRGGLSGERW